MASWRFFLNDIEVEEPIGWDAIEFTALRTDSDGIDQPFSTEIAFYGKGAKLIKALYDVFFINAQISVRITSDVYINGVAWEFNGFVNLSIYSERNVCDTDSWEITVGIVDDNFREKFKSRMGVEVDLNTTKDLDGNDIFENPFIDSTRLHTQELYLAAFAQDLIKETNPSLVPLWANLDWTYSGGWVLEDFAAIIPAYFQNSDFNDPFGKTFDLQQVKWHPTKGVCFKNNTSFTRTLTFSVKIDGSFIWSNSGLPGETASVALSIMVTDGDDPNGGSETQRYYLGDSEAVGFNTGDIGYYDFNGQRTITLAPGNRVLIFIQWGFSGNVVPGDELSGTIGRRLLLKVFDCCLTITEANSAANASFSETMLVENFLRRLINIITGDSDGLISETFSKSGDGCYWNYGLTTGLKIRRAQTMSELMEPCNPLAEVQQNIYKVSFDDIFEGLNSIFCLGWAYEYVSGKWKVRVETLDYFYRNKVNFIATNVGEVIQSAMTQELANQIKIGYEDTWKNIQVSGLWAIHTERNYYVDNRAMAEGSSKKVEVLSSLIAEGYAIEVSRRLQDIQNDSGSSDRPNDYNLFVIWLNRFELTINDVENSEYGQPNETGIAVFPPGTVSMSSNRIAASGGDVGALYNIYITPARNACRWWKKLGMHTYGTIFPSLKFQVGEYQTTYTSTINGGQEDENCIEIVAGTIAENADINPSLLKTEYKEYLFKPIQIEFSYPQSLCDFINLAENNPYGKVKLTSGSLEVSGYITDISNKPEDDNGGTTSFKLMASNIADPSPEPPQPPMLGAYSDAYSNAYN
jgi:hypothetical protein